MNDVKFLLTQSEKFNKKGEAADELKNLYLYYLAQGEQQVYSKQLKYQKLNNLAFGKITKENYYKKEIIEELGFEAETELNETGLNFYPIIPNLRNAVRSQYNKKYIKFNAKATNPEHTNEVLEAFNNDLAHILASNLERKFLDENPNSTEEDLNFYRQTEEVQRAYQTKVRTKIEQWANHIIKADDLKFDMRLLEDQILDQIFITNDPCVHINYANGNYNLEKWEESNVFSLRSRTSRCYSDSQVVGYFDYVNIGTILNQYASELSDEQVENLQKRINTFHANGFVINDQENGFTGNRRQDQESTQNYLTFKSLEKGQNAKYDDLSQNLFRVCTMYFLLPRKKGTLTYKSGNLNVKEHIDEHYKITYPGIYKKGLPKTADNLIEGEHVDWYYQNELYRGRTIDNNVSTYSRNPSVDGEIIWLELKKFDIQYSSKDHKYGLNIPVYGGPFNDHFNSNFSLTEKCANWQILFNWLWNRSAQLMATEVGRFWAFNQGAIPTESMGESWGKNNLLKWALTGRDNSIAPLDFNLNQLGQSQMQIGGGLGQIVDLTRTSDVLEKVQLAEIVKRECYLMVGLTPEFVYGDISPKNTATSVMQGLQRSSGQIQHLFVRLHEVLKNLRAGMLETAQYIASLNPTSQISYTDDEGVRVIFSTLTEGFSLHKLGIFVESSLSELETLQTLKQRILASNTMGLNAEEMYEIEFSTSGVELKNKIKSLMLTKEKQKERESQIKQQEQEQIIRAQQEQQQREIQAQKERDLFLARKDILEAQVRALGYANDNAANIQKEMEEVIRKNNILEQENFKLELQNKHYNLKEKQVLGNLDNSIAQQRLQERLSIKESERADRALDQKDRELSIREKEVKASENRTKAID